MHNTLGGMPNGGTNRDGNATFPRTPVQNLLKHLFFNVNELKGSTVADFETFFSLDKEEMQKCLTAATKKHLDVIHTTTAQKKQLQGATSK